MLVCTYLMSFSCWLQIWWWKFEFHRFFFFLFWTWKCLICGPCKEAIFQELKQWSLRLVWTNFNAFFMLITIMMMKILNFYTFWKLEMFNLLFTIKVQHGDDLSMVRDLQEYQGITFNVITELILVMNTSTFRCINQSPMKIFMMWRNKWEKALKSTVTCYSYNCDYLLHTTFYFYQVKI